MTLWDALLIVLAIAVVIRFVFGGDDNDDGPWDGPFGYQ